MALHSYFTLNWFFFFFLYNSLTLSYLLPQEFSHSSSLRTNWTQSRQCNLVLSLLVIWSKKQEQEQEQEHEQEQEQEHKQEQEQEPEQEQEQGNKVEWKSDYNDVCSPVDDKAQQKFSDFFFFSTTDLISIKRISNWQNLNNNSRTLE